MFYYNYQLIVTASFNLPIPKNSNILLIVIDICIKCTLHNDFKKMQQFQRFITLQIFITYCSHLKCDENFFIGSH